MRDLYLYTKMYNDKNWKVMMTNDDSFAKKKKRN